MEDVFQQDLIRLFEKNNLPFLLTKPGDIANFFRQVVSEPKILHGCFIIWLFIWEFITRY